MDYLKAVIDDDLFDDSIKAIKLPQYGRLLKEKEKEERRREKRWSFLQMLEGD